ncbi:biotin--[acetyl-CoA-carboxylase] ligase [Tumebacillus flagellatus]|uniref:Bifunctional ligase/repressor BirA n=1 Tax=Tumebacillus flagellatus TaxID=1157490 RepID=A0A074LW61_9BACL|nr:biotin--[acetyl-CoA-carboxylase] ligase [Tumebacillus flagellatus]KEO84288.1 biotin--acetyl-CoA-carboxylase ligase [Tumebacillus flagellatus]
MQGTILHMLRETPGGFVSGEAMCQACGVSRTAIWKHIKDLQDAGYQIEAVRNKGYRLVESPDLVTAAEIREGLQTTLIGQSIIYRESLDSTNTLAQQMANQGAPEGTVVIADEQTSGRGRRGRQWFSPPHSGIWMSLILRPELPLAHAAQITLVAAVALCQALSRATGVKAGIKWPNDILFNGKKCCGILTEMHAEFDQIHHLVVGIGINVNIPQADFPDELQSIATSLQAIRGEKLARAEVVRTVLEEFEPLYRRYVNNGGFGSLRDAWKANNITLGNRIVAHTARGDIEGKALDIDEFGVLLMEKDNGEQEKIYSADITVFV